MFRMAYLLLLLTFCFENTLYSQAKRPSKKSNSKSETSTHTKSEKTLASDGDSSSDNERSKESNPSQANRKLRKLDLNLLYTPLSDYVLNYGAGGSFGLNPDSKIGFNFLMGSKTLPPLESSAAKSNEAKISGLAAYGYYRHFFGNSFNMLAGLGYRTADIGFRVNSKTNSEYLESKIKIESFVLPIALGNHWAFDNGITLGCDWVTYMLAISGKASATTSGNIESSSLESLNEDFLDDAKVLSTKSSLTLFLIAFGYSF